jgi:hypothetical protein
MVAVALTAGIQVIQVIQVVQVVQVVQAVAAASTGVVEVAVMVGVAFSASFPKKEVESSRAELPRL